MRDIHIESISDPFADPVVAMAASRVIAYAGTTGLLNDVSARRLDEPTWNRVVEKFRKLGLGKFRAFGAIRDRQAQRASFAEAVEAIYDAIEASPMPESEWRSMRELLGDDLLEKVLGVSRQSIQRYASGERQTPQEIAERLHVIALISSDLAGSYNEFGIRRWFERSRAQLSGKSPMAILKGEWDPDGRLPRKVRGLAAFLSGAKAA